LYNQILLDKVIVNEIVLWISKKDFEKQVALALWITEYALFYFVMKEAENYA